SAGPSTAPPSAAGETAACTACPDTVRTSAIVAAPAAPASNRRREIFFFSSMIRVLSYLGSSATIIRHKELFRWHHDQRQPLRIHHLVGVEDPVSHEQPRSQTVYFRHRQAARRIVR